MIHTHKLKPENVSRERRKIKILGVSPQVAGRFALFRVRSRVRVSFPADRAGCTQIFTDCKQKLRKRISYYQEKT